MSFSHREDRRGDRQVDILTDEANGIRIAVSRLGAELVSLARRNSAGEWVGFLYRDNDLSQPDKGWANHATVMGYFLHRLKDGRSLYRGQLIEGGTHGFLRHTVWHPKDKDEGGPSGGALTYRVGPDDYQDRDYPLKVSLELSYRLEGNGLTVEFHFTNHEPDLTAHVEFGLHPGFAAMSFDSFTFEMPAGKYRRYFSPQNYLSDETEDIEISAGRMPFARERLPGSYILQLVDVSRDEFVFRDAPTSREVALDLSGVPYLTLWSDGGPFLCVEPCWGLTDRHHQRAFEDKDGIQIIPAKGDLRAKFRMTPRFSTAA
jgi:galactose mutarotase-like enzyme